MAAAALDPKAALSAACARALYEGARAAGAGSRQQRRAAARRFVRRHRRDTSYLRWVYRSVAASSALAVALLGLAPAPAGADGPRFNEYAGLGVNPFEVFDLGRYCKPAFADLDDDGDLDLLVGNYDGTFHFFENFGPPETPGFVARFGALNPLDGEDVGLVSAPAFADLDDDGDLDLISGGQYGAFDYFENTGTPTGAAFVERTGALNPLDGQTTDNFSTPTFVDLDGDGDFDLISGEFYGSLRYFENTGTAMSPAFAERTGALNPLDGEDVGIDSAPALADLDDDGDFDLVTGEQFGGFRYFENTGIASNAAFVERTGAFNPLDGEDVGYQSAPAFADLDDDGDLDITAGNNAGGLRFLSNRNFVPLLGTANPLFFADVGAFSGPAFADLDDDGDRDLVAGELTGTFRYFENTGTSSSAAFIERTGAPNPLDGESAGAYSAPVFADLDDDGDLDLLSGEQSGAFAYFENTGTSSIPAFLAQTGALNPLNGQTAGTFSTPTFADLDGDGDLDLISGRDDGTFAYFENTGTISSAAFIERTGVLNPLNGQTAGAFSSPAFTDLEGDGDLDLVAGASDGSLHYFENTGTAMSPAFVERTGILNPLDREDVGFVSSPAFADLDADDADVLVVGNNDGTFAWFTYCPEPGSTTLLASGAAWLALLDRLWRARGRKMAGS